MPIGLPYNPQNCFQISQLALNANQFEPTSTAENSVPSIIVWDTQLNVIQRVSTLTNIVLEEIGAFPPTNPVIEIPRPEISLATPLVDPNYTNTCQSLFAHYLPTTNNSFLNYNPKYYLFIQKSRKRSIKKNINLPIGKYTKKKPSGIFHPTHQNGINFPNGSFYSGTTAIPLDTEFAIANTPYTKSFINMNPLQFVRYSSNGNIPWTQATLSNFPSEIYKFKLSNKKKKRGKSFLMYLAIGIENPDTTSNYPIIFGQLSIAFKLALMKSGVTSESGLPKAIGVQYLINNSSVKSINPIF